MPSLLSYFLFFCLISCHITENKTYTQPVLHTIPKYTHNTKQNNNKIVGIKDGDTFVVLIDHEEQVVRLAHIDCPEKKQAFGYKAKQFASDLCFGATVNLIFDAKNKYDRNKRLIAEVILPDGRNINKELVKHGLAWHFKKYSTDESYAALEIEARNQKIGIWSEPNPIAPWEWRKGKRIQE